MLHMNYDAEILKETDVIMDLVCLEKLRPHEKVNKENLKYLCEKIYSDDYFSTPIVACNKTFIILDGHHRYNAMKNFLFASHIPTYLIDYENDNLCQVSSWKNGFPVSKGDVVAAGLSSKLMDAKRSKHRFFFQQHLLRIPMNLLAEIRT